MGLSLGIVGLPNVGKSTLFNTLTKSAAAEASNYPFCTINPNVGVVKVPDERLNVLAEIVKPDKIVPAIVEFIDIAGIVEGASKGEGLGNQFLANIRETNAIVQVLRHFEDPNVTHVYGSVDPRRDIEVIEAELILADLQTLERKVSDLGKKTKSGDKDAIRQHEFSQLVQKTLESGKTAISIHVPDEEIEFMKGLNLLTYKPFIYVVNVSEEDLKDPDLEKHLEEKLGKHVIPISAKFEFELTQMSDSDAKDFLKEYGLKESGLNRLIKIGYKELGLQTFLTAGPMEVRAWTCHVGDTAPKAAGVIHTDFEKGFIKAEVAAYEDFVACKGWQGVKDHGKMRQEGREYIMQDGDVVFFKFNN